ncbi:putative membrane protein [Cedratvirus kamchatka]|uniref:Membrane protein n=1 Tax=Cedratvirus kamchatka TaxID=2716914 RepID=A0A6G8MYA2_9VIRU|nr:putative membrane protein [Cedratvirus kamchatka]
MNILPSELVAHVLSFLSLPDRARLALCFSGLYEENILEIQTCRALYYKRPPYLSRIKNMVIKEYKEGFTERPGGLLTIYNAELRQTIFMSVNLKLSGLSNQSHMLRKGQVRIFYLDPNHLTKHSPRGEQCDYGSLYLTEKSPRETFVEEQERKSMRTLLLMIFLFICAFCLFVSHDLSRLG